ncbi:MAG: hypothetical protein H0W61_08540 [Bacteroidetes bacterium]|nr:hypothetical protein [Bacteroidota bacterium]
MKTDDYKLILNHITADEGILTAKYPEKFEQYKQMAHMFLNHKGKHLFEEDILGKYREGMTLEKLFDQQTERFVKGANQQKNGKNQKTWYDLEAYEEIEHKDDFFDYFFACKLRHVGLLEIDSFLEFHLEYNFDSNTKEYFRFLNIIIRKYQKKILKADIVETVREWMKLSENHSDLSGNEKEIKTKNKVKRERDDNVTKLNQEQTALLIHFLQAGKVILKDENLNNKDAGRAFSILTGYSADSLRQNLSKTELQRISTKKNISIVANALTNLQLLIDREIKDKK